MRAPEQIDLKALKNAVVSLNNTGFLEEKIRVVGATKVSMRDNLVANVEALSEDQQRNLPQDIKNQYNFLIEDEVGAPAPTAPVIKAAEAKSKKKGKSGTASAPGSPPATPSTEAREECPAMGTAQKVDSDECKFCKEKFSDDYVKCSVAMKAKRKKDAADKAAAAKTPKYSRPQALVDALRMGPGTMGVLNQRSHELYIDHGKVGNLKEAAWVNRYAIVPLLLLGVVTKNDENVLALRDDFLTVQE